MGIRSNEIQQEADSLVFGGDTAGSYTVWWCFEGQAQIMMTEEAREEFLQEVFPTESLLQVQKTVCAKAMKSRKEHE